MSDDVFFLFFYTYIFVVAANVAMNTKLRRSPSSVCLCVCLPSGDCIVVVAERAVESRNNNDKQFPVILVQTNKRIAESERERKKEKEKERASI